jgi:hypothetical protein
MTKRSFFITLPLCMIVALLAAFLFVSPAFAQDETPPEVVPTETPPEVLPTEAAPVEVLPTEAAPVEVLPTEGEPAEELPTEAAPVEVLPTEAAPVEVLPTEGEPAEELLIEAAPVEEAPEAEPSLAEALDAADVVLAEPSGEALTLAASSSENLIATGDPYFTVGSITYRFMKPDGCGVLSNCWESPTPISAALSFMIDNSLTPTDRKLYVEPDTYTEDVYVDGSLPGVKGLTGLVGMGDLPEDVLIKGFLYIYGFPNGFSVDNLSVTRSSDTDEAAIWTWDNKGTIKLTDVNAQATGEDSTGILITHTGTVELNRVNSSDNGYIGARIWNWGTGGIKITNSTFDRNLQNVVDGMPYFDDEYDSSGNPTGKTVATYRGLDLWSVGPISLFGVSVSGNTGDGAGISSDGTVSVKDSVFDSNDPTDLVTDWGDGLQFFSKVGSLENIQANNNGMRGINPNVSSTFTGKHLHTDGNGWQGVQVYACQYDGTKCTISGAGSVTITDSSSSGNGSDGISIRAKGVVTLTSIYTGYNGEDGIFVDNTYSPGAPAVNLTDIETGFNLNMGTLLTVKGPVTVKDVDIHDNTGDGLNIVSTGTGAITITNTSATWSEMYYNGGYGLSIQSRGAVTLTNLDCYHNGLHGAKIDNTGAAGAAAVTINVLGYPGYLDGFFNNEEGGLQIFSHGVVTLSRVAADSNGGIGTEINNDPGASRAGVPVSISDSWSYRNGSSGGGDGLNIISKGLITLTNFRGGDNKGYGVYLDNTISGSTAGVKINAGNGKGNGFNGNELDGLVIRTNGAVTLTNLYAVNNGKNGSHDGYGVDIINDGGTAAVTIKQVGSWSVPDNLAYGNVFSGNYDGGLSITSKGAVIVEFFQAQDNGFNGIYIDASNGSGAVSLTGTANNWNNVAHNQNNGIQINAKGNITISKVHASNNGYNGAVLSNSNGTGNVTLTDAGFDSNTLSGVDISTKGTVRWMNGTVYDNNQYGANILDQGPGKAVTLKNVMASENSGNGIFVDSKGAVTMSEVEAGGNDGYGAHVVTSGTFTVASSSTGSTSFNGNSNTGLFVVAGGAISLTKIYSAGNGWRDEITGDPTTFGRGIFLNSTNTGGTAAISLTDITSNQNTLDGLRINTKGAVTVNILTTNDNTQYGFNLDQTGALDSSKVITLNLITANNNGLNGININAKGSITTNTITANFNTQTGMVLFNNTTDATGSVTMLNTLGYKYNVAAFNGDTGVMINSNGAVTINQLESTNNTLDGLHVENDSGPLRPAVTLNNVITRYNLVGMDVTSLGVVTINTSWSTKNTQDGIVVYTNNNVNILKTASTMNGYTGIWARNSTGTWTLKLTGSAWFGNLRDGSSPRNTNLYKQGIWIVVY